MKAGFISIYRCRQKMDEKAEVKKLKEQEDVQAALQHTAGTKEPATMPGAKMQDKLWFGTYLLILLALIAVAYLLDLDIIPMAAPYVDLIQRLLIGAILIVLTVTVTKSIKVYLISQIVSTPARYNLTRVLNLVMFLVILIIILSVLSATWYTALVSLGIISLILGFALQTPITSFIGWIYLLIRRPYRVGDRIKIGEAMGDVIDVSYFDTTLWEFGGPYLSTEHPSGRIIQFPNSLVLSQSVYNYSWPLFPYIWNEIKFSVGYNSDLEFVAQTMQQVVAEELGQEMLDRVHIYRDLLHQTPVNELEIQEQPVVHFRARENTWLEAIVRYIVHPKESGRVKTRLIKKLLQKLNAEPERVSFPKGNLR